MGGRGKEREGGRSAHAQAKRPIILVIFGDDIGQANISAFTKELTGYRAPNIDRLAKEGMFFTGYYAEQSYTAGQSMYITGQVVFRTSLSKDGLPAAPVGLPRGGLHDHPKS